MAINWRIKIGFTNVTAEAADFTVYPFFALAMRTQKRLPSLGLDATFGPQLTAWMRRVEALPYFEKTIPPHWRT